MASITVTVAGVTAELDIPTIPQLQAAQKYDIMAETAGDLYQATVSAHAAGREAQLQALAALLEAIEAEKAAALPAVSLTPA